MYFLFSYHIQAHQLSLCFLNFCSEHHPKCSDANVSLNLLMSINIFRLLTFAISLLFLITDKFFAECDAIIDFSFTDASVENIKAAMSHNCSYVLGTTGFNEEQVSQIKDFSKSIPIMHAANMSVGVNVALHYTELLSKSLNEDYDVEIHEMHHREKIDSPSGTALALGNAVAAGRNIDLSEKSIKSRWGIEQPRKRGDIGFSTQRGGDVIGDHIVTFAGNGERLEIAHKATNRDVFANGAVRAVLWLKDQEPGYYNMKDVLGLN